MIKYMLDTNIVIYVIKRKPIELLEVFNRHTYQMAISSITLAGLRVKPKNSCQRIRLTGVS
jgi:tRNA(fMet)-specific endonuclease VapC